MKPKLMVALSIILGLVAAGSVYVYIQNVQRQAVAGQEFISVITVREQIPARTRLSAEMLVEIQVPKPYVHNDAAREKKEVLGGITTTSLVPGEQLLKTRVVNADDIKRGLSYNIRPGKRAIALSADPVMGVGGFLVPGDTVDVLATVEIPGPGGQEQPQTNLLVQDIRVLAVGGWLARDRSAEPVKEMGTITLEVTPAEGQAITLAAEKGRLKLMLRPAVAENKVELPALWLRNIGQ